MKTLALQLWVQRKTEISVKRACREKEQQDALITARSVIGDRWKIRWISAGKIAGDCTDGGLRRDLANGASLDIGFDFERFFPFLDFFYFLGCCCCVCSCVFVWGERYLDGGPHDQSSWSLIVAVHVDQKLVRSVWVWQIGSGASCLCLCLCLC